MVVAKIVALCAALAITVSAQQEVQFNKRVAVQEFWKRATPAQFEAPEDTKAGSTCDAAFGAGYITCRDKTATEIRLCYNPSIGQVCCQNSWGCPSGSYCLTDNLCCPNGVDAATCAGHFSATLPPNLNTADSGPAPAPTSAESLSVYTTFTSTIVSSTPISTVSMNTSDVVNAAGWSSTACLSTGIHSSVSGHPVSLYTAGNSTAHHATGTGSVPSYMTSYTAGKGPATSAMTSAPAVHTGAASSNSQISAMGGLAALLAIAGLL